MPYILSTKTVKGKKKFCMRSKESGKMYCYNSTQARADGMKLHEAFKHGFVPTKKGK